MLLLLLLLMLLCLYCIPFLLFLLCNCCCCYFTLAIRAAAINFCYRIFLQRYIENVKQDTNIGSNILRVSASDEDADNNGAIRYSLTAPFDPADLDYFDIHPESGWIYLRKALDVSTKCA